MPGIIWLASYPKSGNTWLRAFLANYVIDAQSPVDINDLRFHCYGDGFWIHFEDLSGRKKEDLTPQDIAVLRPRVHEWFAQSRPQEVFVKTHNTIATVLGTPLITPSATAGAIYVVRNPLDVAVSNAHHYQVSCARAVEILGDDNYRVPATDGQLVAHISSWSRHVQAWTAAPGLTRHVMRYEDMVRQPESAFAGVVGFLGFPENPARLAKAVRFSSFAELASQEQASGFNEARPDGTARFFRAGRVGQWRDVLDEDLVRRVVADHGATMTKFGYLTAEGVPCDSPADKTESRAGDGLPKREKN